MSPVSSRAICVAKSFYSARRLFYGVNRCLCKPWLRGDHRATRLNGGHGTLLFHANSLKHICLVPIEIWIVFAGGPLEAKTIDMCPSRWHQIRQGLGRIPTFSHR